MERIRSVDLMAIELLLTRSCQCHNSPAASFSSGDGVERRISPLRRRASCCTFPATTFECHLYDVTSR